MEQKEKSWKGVWISDPSYHVESPLSPVPMVFRRRFDALKPIASLRIDVTAMGIFDLWLDEQRITEEYFNPGFTDYSAHLQYVSHEIKELVAGTHELMAVVAGGWAVGRTTHVDDTTKSKSKLSADRQALLCDLTLNYADGTRQIIGTDESFEVSEEGPWRFGDFYDGETYDARIDMAGIAWHRAAPETLRVQPRIRSRYGLPVVAHERLTPVSWTKAPSGEWIADFGQNLAGVVELTVNGRAGQQIVIRHAEALEKGELYVQNLRSAKQTVTYICRE